MGATLNTREVVAAGAAPDRWLAVLHGIFGAGRNWASVARAIARARPDWGLLLVDLRQHGRSAGFEPPHTLARTAADLDTLSGPPLSAVLGHSFGGKVAMLRGHHDHRIEQVWVVDSTPEVREPGGGPWSLLRLLRALPAAFPDRHRAVAALRGGVEEPIARWMATNLERRDGVFRWRIDLDDMEAMLLDFYRTDLWSLVEEPRPGLTVHFVRATASAVLSAEAVSRIAEAGVRTGRVFLHEVRGSHWLNADNPGDLVRLVAPRL
jgi:esterase